MDEGELCSWDTSLPGESESSHSSRVFAMTVEIDDTLAGVPKAIVALDGLVPGSHEAIADPC